MSGLGVKKNLHLLLNTTMREVVMKDESHILAIHAAQLGTDKGFILDAPLFVDASATAPGIQSRGRVLLGPRGPLRVRRAFGAC